MKPYRINPEPAGGHANSLKWNDVSLIRFLFIHELIVTLFH